MRRAPWPVPLCPPLTLVCVVSPLVACYPGGVKAKAKGPRPHGDSVPLADARRPRRDRCWPPAPPRWPTTSPANRFPITTRPGPWRGRAEEIEIVRDRYAVPHILSKTDADAFFGLGFVHAQDRLWQMTLLRRTVQGRLSEIFGPETLRIDELMRALDLYGYARQAVDVSDRRRPRGARGLCRRGERLAQGGADATRSGAGRRSSSSSRRTSRPGRRPIRSRCRSSWRCR